MVPKAASKASVGSLCSLGGGLVCLFLALFGGSLTGSSSGEGSGSNFMLDSGKLTICPGLISGVPGSIPARHKLER